MQRAEQYKLYLQWMEAMHAHGINPIISCGPCVDNRISSKEKKKHDWAVCLFRVRCRWTFAWIFSGLSPWNLYLSIVRLCNAIYRRGPFLRNLPKGQASCWGFQEPPARLILNSFLIVLIRNSFLIVYLDAEQSVCLIEQISYNYSSHSVKQQANNSQSHIPLQSFFFCQAPRPRSEEAAAFRRVTGMHVTYLHRNKAMDSGLLLIKLGKIPDIHYSYLKYLNLDPNYPNPRYPILNSNSNSDYPK
jgi:hypothetical protein